MKPIPSVRKLGYLTLVILGGSPLAGAATLGHFMKIEGNVKIERKSAFTKPKVRDEVRWHDRIVGADDAFVVIKLPKQDFAARGPFDVTLEESTAGLDIAILQLTRGRIRMKIHQFPAVKSSVTVLRTKIATMGVRGTEFYAADDNFIQEETEIVGFDGIVDFAAILNQSRAEVAPGQWGGIGGRYGDAIRPLLNLSPETVAKVKGLLPLSE